MRKLPYSGLNLNPSTIQMKIIYLTFRIKKYNMSAVDIYTLDDPLVDIKSSSAVYPECMLL